jgi:hypothetical protein
MDLRLGIRKIVGTQDPYHGKQIDSELPFHGLPPWAE